MFQIIIQDKFGGKAQNIRHRLPHLFQKAQQRAVLFIDLVIAGFGFMQRAGKNNVENPLLLVFKESLEVSSGIPSKWSSSRAQRSPKSPLEKALMLSATSCACSSC